MKYSIILNSRNRPQYLYNFLESIKNKTGNIGDIETFINFDSDDTVSREFIDYCGSNWSFCSFEFLERDSNLINRINKSVTKLKGEYIWILNDDTELITENWDIETSKILPDGYNNIVYGHVECSSVDKEKGAEYSSFPMLSKKAIDGMGYFINNKLPSLGGDVYLWRIFKELDRIIKLPIKVRHLLHETIEQVINCDSVSAQMRRENIGKPNCWTTDISEEVNKLKLCL